MHGDCLSTPAEDCPYRVYFSRKTTCKVDCLAWKKERENIAEECQEMYPFILMLEHIKVYSQRRGENRVFDVGRQLGKDNKSEAGVR